MEDTVFLKIAVGCVIALFGTLAGSIVYRSHKELDRFNELSEKLRVELRNTPDILNAKSGHPGLVVENNKIDLLVEDILPVFPKLKRKAFTKAWEDYRCDQQDKKSFPSEYMMMGTADARRLIEKRIHDLLSKL